MTPSGPGPLRRFRDFSCFKTVSSLISKTGAVTFVESTIGWLMSGFSKRQKKLLSSFGLKSVLVKGVVSFVGNPLSF